MKKEIPELAFKQPDDSAIIIPVYENTIESILKFRRESQGWITTSHTMTMLELNALIKDDLFNIFSEVRIVVKNGTDVTVTIPR